MVLGHTLTGSQRCSTPLDPPWPMWPLQPLTPSQRFPKIFHNHKLQGQSLDSEDIFQVSLKKDCSEVRHGSPRLCASGTTDPFSR